MNWRHPTRYLGILSAISIIGMLLTSFIMYRIENRAIADMVESVLDTFLNQLSIKEAVPDRLPETAYLKQYGYTLLDIQGTVLDKTGTVWILTGPQSPEVIQARRTGKGFNIRYDRTGRIHIYSLARRLPSGKRIVHIQTAFTSLRRIRNNGLYILFLLILLIISVTSIIHRLFVKHFSSPLKSMEIGITEFAAGNFEHSIYVDRKSSLFLLARTMNKMAFQLKDRIDTIQQQNDELKAILNGMIEPVFVLNGYLMVLRLNSAAEELIGKSSHTSIGHSLLDVYRNTKVYDFAQRTKNSRSFQEAVIRVNEFEDTKGLALTVSSSLRILQAYGVCIKNGEDEETTRIVIVFNDVTRLKRLEEIRKDFVANVSHELKTPATAIQGFVETIIQGMPTNRNTDPETATMMRFLNIIRDHSHRLNLVIEDLLSLSRLEQEEFSIQKTEIPIAAIVREVISTLNTVAMEKNTRINSRIPEGTIIMGDEGLVRQALVNLVDNAVKHSPNGSLVEIDYQQRHKDSIVSVSDNGIPIPEHARKRIFERFYRIKVTRNRNLTGTGLGLSIVRHIMMVHNGKADLVSSPAGNRFSLIFPTWETSIR